MVFANDSHAQTDSEILKKAILERDPDGLCNVMISNTVTKQ